MKFAWTTLHIVDMEASLKFYQEVVGLPLKRRFSPREGMEIAFLGEGETEVELIVSEGADEPTFGEDVSMGFFVDDSQALMKRLEEHQIPIHSGPFTPSPVMRYFYVKDPSGFKVQFVERL